MNKIMLSNEVVIKLCEHVCDNLCKHPINENFDIEICEDCILNEILEIVSDRED